MSEQSSNAPGARLEDAAVELARQWVQQEASIPVDPAAQRLAGVLRDPNGLPFTLGFVDGVMRPESAMAAASNLHRVAPLAPEFLPWYLRGIVRVGGGIAPALPVPTVPIARRVLREMVGHLIVDARPEKLGAALARIRMPSGRTDPSSQPAASSRLNLNLLGEAVLGEAEAKRRLDGIHDLIRRDDVDYVSVKVSAIMSRISMWAFDQVVEQAVERLLPLYLTAASNRTFINLDMEEYKDVDLTVAVFTRLLEDPRLTHLEAGIVLQTYLPDALPALQELTAWARDRVEHGGAPIKVRLVKGANLAMEKVDAVLHGWTQAPYGSKLDTDANYLRCLDFALDPRSTAAVRIGVAGHNLFDIAYAWLLAGERDVRAAVEFEMLLGMAQAQVTAVSRTVGPVLLYVPVVHPDEFDVAISYLVRRLEENASSSNFLSAAFDLASDPALFERERLRFVDSVSRARDQSLHTGPRRTQNRLAPMHESVRPLTRPRAQTEDLTGLVLGIARGSSDDGGMDADSDPFLQTAVYSRQELPGSGTGAPGFANVPDSDPALPANREWARGVFDRMAAPTTGSTTHEAGLGVATLRASRIDDERMLQQTLTRVRDAASAWGARPAADRSEVLLRAAAALAGRRAELIEIAGVETGKTFAEGDVEVSEAIDFANYYAATCRELDGVAGARFEPARVTVVTPPWNFPISIPAGGVLAALAAGSGVVFKPAPQARRCAAVIAEALWQAGVPRDVLVLADVEEGELGQQLISHPSIDRVILTGSWDTAALFRSWRPALPLLAETSGKNALIIAPTADIDLAVADLVHSAFGHAGQKCSAASLAILVGPVGRSKRFARQLVDATRSLRVAWPDDPQAEVGPVIERPQGKLAWALTQLEGEEQWLVEPRSLDETGRLWSPGIRVGVQPGSRTHLEEFFGPMLGIMHATTLAEAIRLQNAVAYGLTAGLHTQDPADLALWLDEVQAGNLYVNRGITGAIVQRQPFGGWKRSSVGPGAKAGGPNYLIGLGSWRSQPRGKSSSTLHLRGLDARISGLIESAQPSLDFDSFEWLRQAALSDAVAWDREFGQVRDVSQLGVERNLFRYRPVPVSVRAASDAALAAILRVVLAGIRSGADFFVSVPEGVPAGVRAELGALEVPVAVESDAEWIERMRNPAPDAARVARVRLVGGRDAVAGLHHALADAVQGDPDLAVYDNEVTSAGRLELLPFVHEQAISITAHRFGTPDPWSAEVI
ncbi:bifunctional proline dehydrogenase/L-glutamate gamma-semialdehyde dehydrogenase [Microbacterium sp. ARD32]|uniref:bifunctional proline dehydrogenase/L-glutamate gamma-semialdehyde dehydrogenase n=1 Tax=Microbacterium sp. ARD32 TaxID=2962577 RepID=UPI0028829930|nr:bifunctional proline dehydrogenase/L-glutamate gamma-semialdehyde dehydrogenase [Microbacterium sp. ARD32]MDT0158171.1 bifunctional proline dehydrogenase/L-glutamate gamma-semialdehyde dehydrogenase [Microbacterium sp. ARD32]